MRKLVTLFAVAGLQLCSAEMQQQAIERAAALKGRFLQFRSAAAATHALASLGAAVCRYDKSAGAGILRDALQSLNTLPDRAFFDSQTVLPVSGFAALTSFLVNAAGRCDENLGIHIASERVRERLDLERLKVTEYLNEGASVARRTPDRAAQLIAAAIGAADPDRFPFQSFIRALAQLREIAPDLADELFESGLQLASQSRLFRISHLAESGEYLFTSARNVESPDEELRRDVLSAGSAEISDWRENRHSANPDAVEAYLTAVKSALEQGAASLQPAMAYGIAYQMLHRVADLLPPDEEVFRRYLTELSAAPESQSAAIQGVLGPMDRTGDREMNREYRRDGLIRAFRREWVAGHIEEARRIYTSLDDGLVLRQLAALLQWGEAMRGLKAKDLSLASGIASQMRAGPRRALLYCAIAAANRDGAVDELEIAWREVESYAAEERAYMLVPIATLMLGADPEAGYALLSQIVTAHNDALSNPRRARFDPGKLRKQFRISPSLSADSNLLLRSGRAPLEVVDSGRNRHGFRLEPPGVTAFSVADLLQAAGRSGDLDRLDSIVLGYRDESRRAVALIALAESRLAAAVREQH